MEAFDHFANSVRHFAAGELNLAAASARRASELDPEEQLYVDAARYLETLLESESERWLVREPDAFSAFISGGSNLPLYDNTRLLLLDRLHAIAASTLLDIGSGEGTIIIPVMNRLPAPPLLTLCEPSVPLLERATQFGSDCGVRLDAYPYPIEDVLRQTERAWDAAVATWSLQALAPDERQEVLALLARRVRYLLVAEFDDCSGSWNDLLAEERIRYIHDRYAVGVQEYPGAEERRVRQQFLMPVLYGNFSREGKRSFYEQPMEQWEADLRAAGFTILDRTLIFPYWWADAYLIVAQSQLQP